MTRATLCCGEVPEGSWGPCGFPTGVSLYGASPIPGNCNPASVRKMTLRLYDTLTRKKRDFVPINPQRVTMYVCGPTVYNYAHIGNARPVAAFDVLFRV